MFHPEEHAGDRFRVFVNQHVFHGIEALLPLAVLWINLPGVWGIGLFSIYAAGFLGIGWGLSIVYLVLVNAVAHIVAAILWRKCNPGLWTAVILFVPLGTLALLRIAKVPRRGADSPRRWNRGCDWDSCCHRDLHARQGSEDPEGASA
jgi:hypothetical protein